MAEYQLELKQIVSFPRCRIYRQFIRSLMEDRSIRVSGCSYFYFYTVLCSYANYQTSYQSFDGIRYIVFPGEWICPVSEIAEWFRMRSKRKALQILKELQEQHFIEYSLLGRGKLVKFKIKEWRKSNRLIEDHAPCQKDTGFFFFPISKAHELVSLGRCSEMDIVLDLWMHAIYNDPRVQGSELGPVVYFRNYTGSPLTTYTDMALRWGISRSTVCRLLKKLESLGYVRLLAFSGRHGSTIYLNNYLSTMFGISDVMVDKDEVAMTLNLKVNCPSEGDCAQPTIPEEQQVTVSIANSSVSKSDILWILQKVAQVLISQGFSCAGCARARYRLSNLSPGCGEVLDLHIGCENWADGHFTLRFHNCLDEPTQAVSEKTTDWR